jgi:prolyl oligopeptidase
MLHGVPVADPFRPLEHAGDSTTRAWVDAENTLTRRVLDGAARDRLVERLRQLHRHPRSSIPAVRGERVFFTHNDGTVNQPLLYVAAAGDWGLGAGVPPALRVLVDPNQLGPDGTTAITEFEPDAGGTRVAYAVSVHGSDQQELRIVNVAAGRTLEDRIRWVKFASIAWRLDGFFYTRFPEPGSVPPDQEPYYCQVWHHRLGTDQADDRLIYRRTDRPDVVFDVDLAADGRSLIITSRLGASDKAEVHVLDAASMDAGGELAVTPLVTGFSDGWHFAGGDSGRLFFRTDAGAPRGRVVAFDVLSPGTPPRVLVAETHDPLIDAVCGNNRLLLHSLHDASGRLSSVALDGGDRRDLRLPALGTILGIGSRLGDPLMCVTFMSFTTPPEIYRCDDASGVSGAPLVPGSVAFDATAYVTQHVWYPSKDGTSVSMFLVQRRADAPEHASPRPVLLTGYGGFNISLTPTFDPSDFLWLEHGGTLAVAHLRGGGEYGEAWHQAGMLDRKQTVFDDFIAAAEWLLSTGRASGIAIEGGSNGGLLVGAAIVQRPDLFRAAICRVPVADMLRYHLFTVGRFWIPEYGSADDPQQFTYLRRYSPYHNVVDGVEYPPTLVMTADTDDRVDPGMAKKFAARLQEAVHGTSGGPILLRVEARAGHGLGKPIGKLVDEQADFYAFLMRAFVTPRARASTQSAPERQPTAP